MNDHNHISDLAFSESPNTNGQRGADVTEVAMKFSLLPPQQELGIAPANAVASQMVAGASNRTTSSLTELDRHRMVSKLENPKPIAWINGKPVFMDRSAVLNLKSGFGHKLLCDSLTFTAGSVCVFGCVFCYVGSIMRFNPFIERILRKTGLGFADIIVRREDPVAKLRKHLAPRGKPKFHDPADTRVIYSSPLVDIAATMQLAHETIQMCMTILELTFWQIRLLSKSPLLLKIAEEIPNHYQPRMIYGLSTGTLDDGIARTIEKQTGLVSKRLQALHALQDRGLRTYGMLCPILPQDDPKAYAEQMSQVIGADRCEDVWAEIMNVRGRSFTATHDALKNGGYLHEAAKLKKLHHRPKLREQYARDTFLALADILPAKKLHFLQYVNKHTIDWWRARQHQGAVLLGNAVHETTNVSAPISLRL